MLLIKGVLEQNVPLEMSSLKVYNKVPAKMALQQSTDTHRHTQTEKAVKRPHTHTSNALSRLVVKSVVSPSARVFVHRYIPIKWDIQLHVSSSEDMFTSCRLLTAPSQPHHPLYENIEGRGGGFNSISKGRKKLTFGCH